MVEVGQPRYLDANAGTSPDPFVLRKALSMACGDSCSSTDHRARVDRRAASTRFSISFWTRADERQCDSNLLCRSMHGGFAQPDPWTEAQHESRGRRDPRMCARLDVTLQLLGHTLEYQIFSVASSSAAP